MDRQADCSGETKVSNLQFSLFADQQVLWLQVAVNDSVFVTVVNTGQKLTHEFAHFRGTEGSPFAVSIHILPEILVTELEGNIKLIPNPYGIINCDNVCMFQLLHQRDLANRGRGESFAVVNTDYFEGNLVARAGILSLE